MYDSALLNVPLMTTFYCEPQICIGFPVNKPIKVNPDFNKGIDCNTVYFHVMLSI